MMTIRAHLFRLAAIVACLGFAASLVVHGTTYAGIDLSEKFAGVWGLHVLIFPLFFPMVVLQQVNGFAGRDFWKAFLAPMPKWVKLTLYALMAYTVINFLLFFYLSKDGAPDVIDGQYVLNNHGTVTQHLTAEEYARHKAYTLRGFSGHWLCFYFLLSVFYLFPSRNKASET